MADRIHPARSAPGIRLAVRNLDRLGGEAATAATTPKVLTTRRAYECALAACALVLLAACGSSSAPGVGGDAPRNTERCAEPVLTVGAPGPATDDAAGRGQMFEQIALPGITDFVVEDGTGGVAFADLNGDGLLDILAVSEIADFPEAFRFYINRGCWQFERQELVVLNPENLPRANHSVPVFADFNNDGLLDFYLTGDPSLRYGTPHPNMLFLARGDYRSFEEVGHRVGAQNATAYSRQSQIVDVNGDGWLDIAIAADQIGDRTFRPGVPWQRLYIYQPAPSGVFEDGSFEDIGGTAIADGFGGEPNNQPDHDRSSPTILLRDIDGDGDIDIVQSYHIDMVLTPYFMPNANDERHHGVFVWKNQLADTGEFRFVQEQPGTGGLAEEGWSQYSVLLQDYVPVQHAVSHPYLTAADTRNLDRLDILTLGSTDLQWHIHTDQIAAKFWRNQGDQGFVAATEEAGLEPLNWGYGDWFEFFGAPPPPLVELNQPIYCATSNRKPRCLQQSPAEHQLFHADAIWADFNNDGWIDLLTVDRRENSSGYGKLRNILFMNRGDGTFEPIPTSVSGIDENGIAAEAVDLNGDGLLDIYVIKDINNSDPLTGGLPNVPPSEFTDSVFWNTGLHGGRDNHWMRVRLAGRPHGELIGAKLRVYAPDGRLIGRRDLFPVSSFKSSLHLEVHFGLGQTTSPRLEIELPGGRRVDVRSPPIDAVIEVDVSTAAARVLRAAVRQDDSASAGE